MIIIVGVSIDVIDVIVVIDVAGCLVLFILCKADAWSWSLRPTDFTVLTRLPLNTAAIARRRLMINSYSKVCCACFAYT